MMTILQDGIAAGTVKSRGRSLSSAEKAALAPVRVFYPDVPADVIARGLHVWMALFGMITFELFGHLHNVIADNTVFFELELSRLADIVLD